MKYVVVLLGLFAMFSCTEQNGFKMTVKLDGAEGKVILEDRVAGEWIGVDTAEVVDGIAVLEGVVEYPSGYYLSLLGDRNKTLVFVENNEMTVEGNAQDLRNMVVTGSLTHDEYAVLDKKLSEMQAEYNSLYAKARKAFNDGETETANALRAEIDEMYESMNGLQETFVVENPTSYAAPYFLARIMAYKSGDELEVLVNGLDPALDQVYFVEYMKERVSKLQAVKEGMIAPDFTQNDVNGNPVKLSDVYAKNELTLIDFWASWCGPCRAENPFVVEVYNEYKDKGFSVLGVSLDKDKDKWIEAIEKDNLTWDHVSDLAYWSNAAAQLYAINSVPSSLIVDKTGKIIAKNKRGEELKKFVADYFESN